MSLVKENLAGALLKPINPAASVILGVYTILWGFWVINPLWSVFALDSSYLVMLQIAPEWAWGTFALVCGVVMSYGATKRSYRALTNGAGVVFGHWMIVGLCYFLASWQGTAGITALVIASYSAFVYLNIRVNYKETKLLPDHFYTQ